MSQLFWKPQEELIQQSWAFAQGSQIGRFLGVSTVLHFVFAMLSPWLFLTFSLTSQEERLVIRVVDFVLPAETAPTSEKRETKGGGGGGPVKPPKIAKPVRRQPSAVKRAAPGAPAPSAASKVADIPGPREIAVPSTPARERALRAVGPAEVPVAAQFKSVAEDVKALAESVTRAEKLPARPPQLAPETRVSETTGPREVAATPRSAPESGPAEVEPGQGPVAPRSGSGTEAVKRLAESLSESGDLPTLPSRAPSAPTPATGGPKALGSSTAPRGSGGTGPAPVAGPSSQVAVGGEGAGSVGSGAGQVVALARELSGGGEGGPIATVASTPAAEGPKAVAGSTAPRGSGGTGPAPVAGPSSQVAAGGKGAGGGGARQAVALARELSGGGGRGPVATVAVPRELVRDGAGRGGVGSGGGAGTGVGRGVGSGGSTSIGPGAGRVDTRDPDFSEYFRIIEKRVRASWKFPESLEGTTQTVKLGFSLRLDGSLQDVRVVSSTSGTLNVSALAAMKRASPFPSLPAKFHALAGQPLVMSFTVTIK